MRRCALCLALILLACQSTFAQQRAKIPPAAKLDTARKEIREIYQPEFAKATTSAQKAELAKSLIAKAAETPEPASHYMLLSVGKTIAVQANNVALAFEATDKLNEAFEIDSSAMKKEALEAIAAAPKTTAKDRTALIAAARRLAIEAARADQLDKATWAAELAVSESKKLRERSAAVRQETLLKFIKILAEQSKDMEANKQTLAKQPDSKSANESLGRFYCFYKNEWERGLPMLALGDSATLKTLAIKEIKNNATAADKFSLANDWWDAAGTEPNALAQQSMKQRAIHWYEQVGADLTGLNKDKAQRRIAEKKTPAFSLDEEPEDSHGAAEAEAPKIAAGRPGHNLKVVDLIALADPKADGHPAHKWRVVDKTLECTEGNFAPKLVFPYEPPTDYDLKFTFMVPQVRNALGVLMPNPTRKVSFGWGIGGGRREMNGFSLGDKSSRPVDAPMIAPGRRYTVTVKVRAGEVAAFIDGKLFEQYKTNFNELFVSAWHRIDQDRQLAVFSDDPCVFYEVKVTEVKGQGKLTRQAAQK